MRRAQIFATIDLASSVRNNKEERNVKKRKKKIVYVNVGKGRRRVGIDGEADYRQFHLCVHFSQL